MTEATGEKKPAQGGVVRVPLESLVVVAARIGGYGGEPGYYLDVISEAKKARELLVTVFQDCGIPHEMPPWPPRDDHLKSAVLSAVKSGKLFWTEALDLLEGVGLPTSHADCLKRGSSGSKGAVTRRDLRPDDWHLIWPELAKPARKTKEAAHG